MDAVELRLSGRQRRDFARNYPRLSPGDCRCSQVFASAVCVLAYIVPATNRPRRRHAREADVDDGLAGALSATERNPRAAGRIVRSTPRSRGLPLMNNFFTPIFRLTKHHPLPWVPLRAINVPIEPPQAFASRNRCVALPPGIRACLR